jgi:ketopantoate hydroxymethyltransferase
VKRYAEVGDEILVALKHYANDVRTSQFPEQRHTYSMPQLELDLFAAFNDRSA